MKQPEGLISVLGNQSAPHGDRLDAAMDLGAFDEREAVDALLRVALNHAEDTNVADYAGESLWEIWTRTGEADPLLIARLHPEARKYFSVDAK